MTRPIMTRPIDMVRPTDAPRRSSPSCDPSAAVRAPGMAYADGRAAPRAVPSWNLRACLPARLSTCLPVYLPACLLGVLLALVSLPALGPGAARAQGTMEDGAAAQLPAGRITVTGTGSVAAVPDEARISLAVVREAENAGDALAQASTAAADVLAAMAEMGIDARDIATTDVSLDPVYGEFEVQIDQPPDRPRGTPPVVAYRARNALSVRVRDLDMLGAVIDRSVAMGANEGGGLQLTVSNAEELRGEARALAVRDAATRAAGMAEAAGVSLGALVALDEGGAQAFPPAMGARMAMAESVPIAAGETEITASVTAVYAIGE